MQNIIVITSLGWLLRALAWASPAYAGFLAGNFYADSHWQSWVLWPFLAGGFGFAWLCWTVANMVTDAGQDMED